MCIKTETMLMALQELRHGTTWIKDSQRFFTNLNRETLTIKNLNISIELVKAQAKTNETAKRIYEQLSEIQIDIQAKEA